MIVYGDPSTQAPLRALVGAFERDLASGLEDDLRRLLVRAGMLEQAVEDALPAMAEPYRRLTDALSEGDLDAARRATSALPHSDDEVTVKLPEGFAFYALYPEAYAAAALRWRAALAGDARPLVVGVRSIGTTLSAVVAATLRRSGLAAERLTVRPTGHPFARESKLDDARVARATHALVVDEGPGLSGSSMASVAEALVRAGMERERIAFFPGHGGEPGGQASENVRRWWATAPRYTVPTEELRWEGRTLEETLALAADGPVEEITGGHWRTLAYDDPADWPAAVGAFERRKLLARRADGPPRLWKFAGFTVPETTLGFSLSPWIEGQPLTRDDATPERLAQIGRHLSAVAGPPLTADEVRQATQRLVEMLRHNAEEAGLSAAEVSRPPLRTGAASAGDYRTAPSEWRLVEGRMVKAGRISATLDHTVVDRQPIVWDVAGAMVEWELDDASAFPPVEPDDLRFYRCAYAAYRLGVLSMGGPDEAERLKKERAFYRNALERLLSRSPF